MKFIQLTHNINFAAIQKRTDVRRILPVTNYNLTFKSISLFKIISKPYIYNLFTEIIHVSNSGKDCIRNKAAFADFDLFLIIDGAVRNLSDNRKCYFSFLFQKYDCFCFIILE